MIRGCAALCLERIQLVFVVAYMPRVYVKVYLGERNGEDVLGAVVIARPVLFLFLLLFGFVESHKLVKVEDIAVQFEIPVYLSDLKSKAYSKDLSENQILITADTIVWFENQVINKPKNRADAVQILERLSGNSHEVITGVSLRNKEKIRSFYSHSRVTFSTLSKEEINYYIDHYEPFDKAGAYGIQEWIGYIGISRIEGSFFNVMGLPIQQLYHELGEFIK